MYEFTQLRSGKTRMYILFNYSRIACEHVLLLLMNWHVSYESHIIHCFSPLEFRLSVRKTGTQFCASPNPADPQNSLPSHQCLQNQF